MPDNKVNGEGFKNTNPKNGVNNKEEGSTKKFSTEDPKKDTKNVLSGEDTKIVNEDQVEDKSLDNNIDSSKDDENNKSVPFSENSKAKDDFEDASESLEEEAPFIEKNSKKPSKKLNIEPEKKKEESKLNSKKDSGSVKKDYKKKEEEKIDKKDDIDIGSLLNRKEVIMIDDNDVINLDDVSKDKINIPKNVNSLDEDHINGSSSKKTDDDNLPNTFDELVAEELEWKPVLKSEEVGVTTIVESIENFYTGNKCYKFPLLNDEDSKITNFNVKDGIYVYKRVEPYPHWHFVTNKLSDLYETLWDGSKLSGVGFEVSFRLKSDEKVPPKFGVDFIQEFSGYAYSSGNFIANEHVIPTKGITEFPKGSLLNGVTVVYDPDLKPIKTSKGIREFLQIVGITKNEQIAIKSWNSKKVLDLFSNHMEFFITDINRKCLMEIERIDKLIQEGIKKDGSNTGMIFSEKVIWKKKRKLIFFTEYIIEVDLDSMKILEKVIKGRIPKARDLIIVGEKNKIIFKPNPSSYTKMEEESLIIGLSPASFKDLLGKIKNRIKIYRVKSLVSTKFRVI